MNAEPLEEGMGMILSEPVGLAMVIAPRGVGSSQSPASFLTWGNPILWAWREDEGAIEAGTCEGK